MKRKILFSSVQISQRIVRILMRIENEIYKNPDSNPLFCIVLKGGYRFGFEILRHLSNRGYNYDITFVTCKSYGENTVSGGQASLTFTDPIDIFKGRDVVILDDVLDTGLTIDEISKQIKPFSQSLKVAVLVNKTAKREVEIKDELIFGFRVDYDYFLLGYGMGHGELYRNESFISYYTTIRR